MLTESLSPGQRRALRSGRPYRVHLVLTHKCNLACEHCYQAEHDSDDLPFDTIVRVLDELADLGVLFLTLGGGEPLARRDFWRILEAARERRFAVDLYTNGTLINADVARRLREAGVVKVELSLHGANAATHDQFVRRKGSFDRTNRALDLLESVGLSVVVKGNLTQANHREKPEMLARIQSRPLVKLNMGKHLFVRDDGDESAARSFHMTEAQEREVVRGDVDRMPREQIAGYVASARKHLTRDDEELAPCQAARTTFAIHPSGDVTPCTLSHGLVMGNVLQRPLAEIWRESAVAKRLRGVHLGHFADCASCEYRKVCNHCMALSHQESGSVTGWSSQVCQTTKVFWSELRRRADELGLDSPFER